MPVYIPAQIFCLFIYTSEGKVYIPPKYIYTHMHTHPVGYTLVNHEPNANTVQPRKSHFHWHCLPSRRRLSPGDPTRFNVKFWQEAERVIQAMLEMNIETELILFVRDAHPSALSSR